MGHKKDRKWRRDMLKSQAMEEKRFAISLVIPSVLILMLTVLIPLIEVIRLSFFDYSLLDMGNITWNSFKNYKEVVKDREFYMSFLRTLYYVGMTVIIQFIIGFALALMLNKDIKGRGFFRSLLFLPWTIPTLVTGVAWMWIFQPQYGVLNYILKTLNISGRNINWLGEMEYAMPSVIVTAAWRQTPLMMVMMLAALQTVPQQLIEASVIDGAGAIQRFKNVTIPCVMSVIKTVTLTTIILNFQMYVLFYTMTGGGPITATTTLPIYTYETAFLSYNMGKGAAVGVLWLMFLVAFSTLYNRWLSKSEVYN